MAWKMKDRIHVNLGSNPALASPRHANQSIRNFATLPYRLSPQHGVRFGEATHPGPSPATIHRIGFVVTNPTGVYNKTSIFEAYQPDLLALSETSATQRVQSLEQRNFAKLAMKTHWGQPMPTQMSTGSTDSLRGAASGVSLHSKFPIRPTYHSEMGEWEMAGRFLHSFAKLPPVECQICTVYGLPASVATSRARTNTLLQHVIHQTRRTTYPTIICGDLNHHPDSLEATQILRAQGYRTAEDLYTELHGGLLPPTFGKSTRNDVMILSPLLCKYVVQVQVDQTEMLAGHHPLMVDFEFPGESTAR